MLSSNEMESSMGVGAAIYGPLLKVLKICALRVDIPPTVFNEANECKKLKHWAKVIFLWFIGVLILYRCIVLAINQYILMVSEKRKKVRYSSFIIKASLKSTISILSISAIFLYIVSQIDEISSMIFCV